MSSGEHHAGMTKGIASGIGLGAISSYVLSPLELTFMAIGCLLGLFLGPDLDHDNATTHELYIQSIFGKPGLWIWALIWEPYKIGIKHRSFWSHTPIIGTVVRLMYCILPVIILLLKDQTSTSIFELIPKTVVAQLIAIPFVGVVGAIFYFLWYQFPNVDFAIVALSLFVGLCVADFGHWVLDF